MDLIQEMSASYMNTDGKVALDVSRKHFGPAFSGEVRGSETERAQRFLHILSGLTKNLFPYLSVTSLKPSSVSSVGKKS